MRPTCERSFLALTFTFGQPALQKDRQPRRIGAGRVRHSAYAIHRFLFQPILDPPGLAHQALVHRWTIRDQLVGYGRLMLPR
jgi:hypothetical protein